MADCEKIINVNPEDDEQQIELSPEQEAQNIGVDAEQGEQIIDVQSAPEAEALEIEQENCEECIFGGRECISVSGIASYTPLTDKPSINGTVLEGDKTLEELGFEDAIEDVKVNGTSLPITDKSVDVSVPTKTSDLTNDSDFITQADIPEIPTKTSELENDSGFITSADIPEVPTKTSQLDNDSGFITSADIPEVPTKTSELQNDSGFITDASLGNYYTKTQTDGLVQSEASAREQADNALAGQISANTQQITQNTNTLSTHGQQISQNTLNLAQEQLSRQNGDNTLQAQIDAISAASDVVDVVGTYTDLQNYDTRKLTADDIVKVLNDENHDNATTYYRWNGSWSFVGSEGSHYTKAEADATFVPQTRTINGQALDENVELDIPTKTSELTNDAGFITASSVPTKTSDLANDSGFIDSSALDDYYDKTETDTLLADKQDKLTAGENITIDPDTNTISATGGGSSTTLYNELGENTDGAITQKASREMIYLDSTRNTLAIGEHFGTISPLASVVVGSYSSAAQASTAFGIDSHADGYCSVAMGDNSKTSQNSYYSAAIGFLAECDSLSSVALGSRSKTTRKGEVNVGTSTYNEGYDNTNTRVIGGVHAGVQDTDAVNVAQLNAVSNTIPTATSDLTNDSGFITSEDLPVVPTKTSDLTNDSGFITSADVPTATSELTNDSGFITSADLPTVNDATLTIQKNGTNVATFTANSATNQTANITVPTATSELTNDSNFITSADLPTIDSTLSTSSTNAVENQAIANALDLKYDKAGGEITGNAKVDGVFTLDIEDEDYDAGINFTRTLDNNLGTTLTLTGYAGGTNYRTLLRNIATPNSDYDAANKKYVDDHILTPVNYLVALDQNGAIDLVSSSLNYATVKAYLTNSTKDVYLDVLWEPSRFYVKAVQDEDTNNGPINFIGSYSRGGKFYTALFMLDSSNNLTVLHLEPQLTYEKAQAITSTNISSTTEYPTTKAVADYVASELTPTVIYSDATGLSPLQADVSASIAYQLTGLDLSPYKRIKVHVGSGGSSGTGFKSSGVIELSLDANLANASTGQWVGSVITENAADRNRLSAFLVAVSPDKTSFAYARATSLYGTAATNVSDSYVKLIEGFKY